MTQKQIDRQFYQAIRSLGGLAAVVDKAIGNLFAPSAFQLDPDRSLVPWPKQF